MKRWLPWILSVSLVATLALAGINQFFDPVVFQDVVRFSVRGEQSFPAASAYRGNVLYGTDGGTLYVSNGVTWNALAAQGNPIVAGLAVARGLTVDGGINSTGTLTNTGPLVQVGAATFTGGTATVDAGLVAAQGITIGIGGTAITYSSRGSANWDFPSLSPSTELGLVCAVTDPITTAGATFGDSCTVGSNLGQDGGAGLLATARLGCWVTGLNATVVQLCFQTTDAGVYDLHDAGFFPRTFR